MANNREVGRGVPMSLFSRWVNKERLRYIRQMEETYDNNNQSQATFYHGYVCCLADVEKTHETFKAQKAIARRNKDSQI